MATQNISGFKEFDKNVNFFGIVEIDELLMDYSEKVDNIQV